jgi:hypothetical protein
MFKKLFFALFLIFFFLLFVYLGAALIYSQQKNISFREELKTDSKNIISQIKNVLYYQATENNPQGDVVPDSWDNVILGKIKSIIR